MTRSHVHSGIPAGSVTDEAVPAPAGPGQARGQVAAPGVWTGGSSNTLWLALVAVGFAMLQVAALGGRFVYSDDEAVYLSQVNPAVPSYVYEGHRAIGMPLLMAPVAVWNAPVEIVRWYLVVMSSVALFAAFWPWLRVRSSPVVPVAAGLFGFSYLVVYLAGFVLPNYYSALAAVAATGLFLRCARGGGSRWVLVGLAAAIGTMGLVRPSDSLWLALPLIAMWLGVRRWRRLAIGAAIGAGLLVGWGSWLVESWLRFPSPAARMREASQAVDGGLHVDLSTVELYVRMWSAGRLECFKLGGVPCLVSEPIQPVAFVWLMIAAGFGVWGLLAGLRGRAVAEVAVPVLVGASLAFQYLFMLRYGAARFLVPSGAVLAVPVAYGVVSALRVRRRWLRPVVAALAAVIVLGQLPLHRNSVDEFANVALTSGSYQPVLVERLREMGVTPPCAVLGDGALGAGYRLRCDVLWLGHADPFPAAEPEPVARARSEGKRMAVILNRPPPAGSYLDRWRRLATEPGGYSYLVFLPPGPPDDRGRRE